MSFLRAARGALAGRNSLRPNFPPVVIAIAILVGANLVSCGGSSTRLTPNHSAYVSLPGTGNVILLHINGANGIITKGAQTPQVLDASTTGLALLPSQKFLYAVNSFSDTISIFNVASDGTLALSATPTLAGGSGPGDAVIDPTGNYLLVANSLSSSVSVFSIDASTGALTPTTGSPFFANADPDEILFMPSGNVVYVSNPGIGAVTIFSFSNGVLSQLSGLSPVFSGAGASGLALDAGGRFLYVANSSAINAPPYTTTYGNISGFNVNPANGALTPLPDSPFTVNGGAGPTALAVSPGGNFLYASTPGTADSIWCFNIDATSGQLTPAANSPFSLPAGASFALFDPTGGYLYVGNSSGTAVDAYTYNPSTGALTAVPGSPFSVGTPPGQMVFSTNNSD